MCEFVGKIVLVIHSLLFIMIMMMVLVLLLLLLLLFLSWRMLFRIEQYVFILVVHKTVYSFDIVAVLVLRPSDHETKNI